MKNFLICTTICCALIDAGLAQQNPADAPPTQADVEKYMQVMHSREMIDQMLDSMSKPMHQMVHDTYLKNQDKLPADFETRMNRMMDDMLRNMPWDEVVQAMVPAYQKHLTKGDIDALVAFYSTPTGQKVLRETPGLLADYMTAVEPIMRKHVEAVTQRGQQEMEAMRKESVEKAAPADVPQPKTSFPLSAEVSQGLLVKQVPPVYPPLARQARIQGTVVLRAIIAKDGSVENLELVSGHPMLVNAAMDAVKQWQYKPYVLKGAPVEVQTTINVNFVMNNPQTTKAN